MRTLIWLSFISMFLVITVLPVMAIEDKGLILYFNFDKAKGNTVEDMTGNKNDGDLQGKAEITTQTQKYGDGALEIGPQNAVMVVDSFKELEEYQDNTYLWWIYFTEGSNGSWSQIIVKLAPGSDRSPGIWINPGNTGIHYRYNPGNQGAGAIGPGGEGKPFDLEEWHHVAGVKKGGEMKVYIDGEEDGKYPVPKDHVQGDGALHVGKSPTYRAATYVIDDLAVYDRALTEKEVVAVMEGSLAFAPVEPQGKLAVAWAAIKRLR